MSTRIGITLEKELYEKYKEYLWRNKKTIQKDLEEKITETIREWEQNKEQ